MQKKCENESIAKSCTHTHTLTYMKSAVYSSILGGSFLGSYDFVATVNTSFFLCAQLLFPLFSLQVFRILSCVCIFASKYFTCMRYMPLCMCAGVWMCVFFSLSVCCHFLIFFLTLIFWMYTRTHTHVLCTSHRWCIQIINRPQSVLCVMKIYIIFEINLCLECYFVRLALSYTQAKTRTHIHLSSVWSFDGLRFFLSSHQCCHLQTQHNTTTNSIAHTHRKTMKEIFITNEEKRNDDRSC